VRCNDWLKDRTLSGFETPDDQQSFEPPEATPAKAWANPGGFCRTGWAFL